MKKIVSQTVMISVFTLSVCTYAKWYIMYPPLCVNESEMVCNEKKPQVKFKLIELISNLRQ